MWELDYKEGWVPKNWVFWLVVLEKTLESPLNSKAIQPIHPKGNQSWIFIGRTNPEAEAPVLWLPDRKNWLIWKDPDAGNNWRQEEKGTKENEIFEWHHRLVKPLIVWITINCGRFWKRWEYQTTWPASWETYMQVRKQQLEPDMEQQTGSK